MPQLENLADTRKVSLVGCGQFAREFELCEQRVIYAAEARRGLKRIPARPIAVD